MFTLFVDACVVFAFFVIFLLYHFLFTSIQSLRILAFWNIFCDPLAFDIPVLILIFELNSLC